MKAEKARFLLKILIVLLVVFGLFVVIRNLPFFEIKQVYVTFSDNVYENSPDVQRIVNKLKGLNLFEVSSGKLKRQLLGVDFVDSVKIKRYFPSTLEIKIDYRKIIAGFVAPQLNSNVYYLADKLALYECSKETYRIFKDICEVKLDYGYSKKISSTGFDTGFTQMLNLVDGLSFNSLITGVKYENNNLSGFGRLYLDLSLGTMLRVMEPVEQKRLLEAIEIISGKAVSENTYYDLYSVTLVKRNLEEEIGSR